MLSREPEYDQAAGIKAYDLLKLGRPDEALATLEGVRLHDDSLYLPLAAAVNYALGRYEEAARLAQKAAAQMNTQELGNPNKGAINLVWAAAEARLERPARARTALANFNTSVPGVTTLAQMRAWMHPMADLAGYEPLFEGLRLAGVQE